MRWGAIFVLPESERPHPRRPYRGCMYLQDTADDDAIGKHVIVVIVPLARGPACRCAFEDQVVFVHLATNVLGCVRPKLVIITVAACRETFSEAPLSWLIGRVLVERMRASLGQPIIIENVTGAGGSIGVGRVARAPPDGYTLVIGISSTHVVNGAFYALKYDVLVISNRLR